MKKVVGGKKMKYTSLFGWCLTNQHGQCKRVITTMRNTPKECGCECHGEEKD